ncbi:MAG: extracellular solute-binding protein [bacterium]|nr:extracellular solute-binding protein [bacterium]
MRLSLFQGILLGVFGLAALIGIFVFANYTGVGSQQAQIGTVVIWGTLPRAHISQVLISASQANPDLKGLSYVQKSASTFRSELVAAIAEGGAPDLVLITQEDLLSLFKVIQLIGAATLSERTFKDAFAIGGEVYLAPGASGAYGIPFLIDPLVLYENRTILSSSGIAQAPTTWEALTGLVPRVATKTASGNIDRALIALGTYGNVHNARGILSALFLQAGAPLSKISDTGFRRADLGASLAEGTPPGQAVLRFYTQFADSSKVSYTWNASLPDSQTRFLTGDLALYLGYASEAAYLKQANPNLDFDVAPLPQLATSGTKSTYGLIYAFAIPRGARNPSGAYLAAAALIDLVSNRAAAVASGMAPASRALLASPPSTGVAAVAYASALYTKGWLSPAPPDTDSVFSTMISNVISGRQTLDSALASAESALSALLQQ